MNGFQKIFLPGLARALTSIVHGEPPEEGARASNVTSLRRIAYVLSSGTVADVPAVSGNAIRGLTRRIFIDRTLAALDAYNLLDKHVAYFLLAGGATDPGTASIGGPEFRRELRDNLPFVDLLGGSLRGCFLPGRLRVGFMIPVTRETYESDPIAADYGAFDSERLPPLLDLNNAISSRTVKLTRYDEGIFTPDEEVAVAEVEPEAEEGQQAGRRRASGRMIYTGQAIPINNIFTHYFALEWAPEPTVNAFWAFVDCFVERSEVGGWHAKGCGRVELKYFAPSTKRDITPTIKEKATAYWQYLKKNKETIRNYLAEASPAEGRREEVEAIGVKCWDIPFARSPYNPKNLRAFRALKRLLEAHHFALVHVHTPVAAFVGRYLAKATSQGPVLYTAHGFHFYKGAPLRNWLIYYTAERLASRWTDGLIVMNSEDFDNARRLGFKPDKNLFYVHGVGVDLSRYSLMSSLKEYIRSELGLSLDGVVVTCVAEMNPNKNHILLLNAWKKLSARHPYCHLLLVGTGELMSVLQNKVKKEKIPRVYFLGYRRDVPQILQESDIVTLTSKREGLPKSIMEAMAAGKPVVATDVRGNRDLVEQGTTGFLVKLGDVEGLATALEELVSNRYEIVAVIAEQGSGLNEKRKGLARLFRMAREGRMDLVVIEFKDRLARFGFTYIERFFNTFGVRIEVVNGEEPRSLQEELVQDMLSILTVFSAKLYGSRSKEFRKKVREAMADAAKGE